MNVESRSACRTDSVSSIHQSDQTSTLKLYPWLSETFTNNRTWELPPRRRRLGSLSPILVQPPSRRTRTPAFHSKYIHKIYSPFSLRIHKSVSFIGSKGKAVRYRKIRSWFGICWYVCIVLLRSRLARPIYASNCARRKPRRKAVIPGGEEIVFSSWLLI